MRSHADGSVQIQTSAESVPSTPSWFGEIVLLAAHLRKQGILSKISERVRSARRRFGHYEGIDFLAVLFGYAERRRTHPGSFLRAAPALCGSLHGRGGSVIDFPPVRRSRAFWHSFPRGLSKPCARSFSMISSAAPSRMTQTRSRRVV
jgi:hypothetical protein